MVSPPKKRSSTIRAAFGSMASSAREGAVEQDRVNRSDFTLAGDIASQLDRNLLGAGAALDPVAAAGIVDGDAPHHLRGERIELRAILPGDALIDEPEKRFVDERRALQRAIAASVAQVGHRHRLQLVVDERNEPIAGRAIALAPGHQELRDLSRLGGWRHCHIGLERESSGA